MSKKGKTVLLHLTKEEFEELNTKVSVDEITRMKNLAKFLSKSKGKNWGEDGFVGKLNFGCYVYNVVFTSKDNMDKFFGTNDISNATLTSISNLYGAVCYDEQIIIIRADATEQMKKLTMWHEMVHIIFENNNIAGSKVFTTDEHFVDIFASRIYELTSRNPTLMKWLMG